MLAKLITYVVLAMLGREGGTTSEDPRIQARAQEVQDMATMFVEVTEEGKLVDPTTDAIILTTIAWYESRVMKKPKDGDPMHLHSGTVGTVVGPMQISKAAPGWVRTWPKQREKWGNLTVKQMRDPRTNVELAYDILQFYKEQCGGLPGTWIAAYGMGHCPKRIWGQNYAIGWEGKRRCRFLTKFMKRVARDQKDYELPGDWACIHSPK